jgi:hypothetical protein
MENRFYVASDKLQEVADKLIEKGFEEQDACLEEQDELAYKIFIDTEKKTFYYTDDESLVQTNLILVEKFKQSYKGTTLKKIQQWQN